MSPEEIATLQASSALAWAMLNRFKTENQQELEFKKHRYLIDIMTDEAPNITLKKSAQCGGSVAFILKAAHTCRFRRENVIYVLPTQNIVKDFVQPKVDPLIAANPALSGAVTKDSVSLKQIGDRFLYFKGSSSEREAIAISGDTLILDELDRMIDMQVVNTYDSRLQASKNPRRWRLSNPSGVGYGIDQLFNDGTGHHWFVKCSYCAHEWYLDFEPDNSGCHYIDIESATYRCGKCDRPLTDADRQNGRWVAKYPDREAHSYWLSQLMVPYVSAARILEQQAESNPQFFHNFVLGKAYTPTDLVVNRETILRACAPSRIAPTQIALGVDQKAGELHWVALAPEGLFAHGTCASWEEIEHIKLTFQATVVCDMMPYPTMPKHYAEKYDDWYLCLFKESKTLDLLSWKGSMVYADRTRLLDTVAAEITEAKLIFRERPSALEDYIRDWQNLYRTTVEEDDGRQKSTWLKKANCESDYPFATAYARIGLSRLLTTGQPGQIIGPMEQASLAPVTSSFIEGGKTASTLGDSVENTLSQFD